VTVARIGTETNVKGALEWIRAKIGPQHRAGPLEGRGGRRVGMGQNFICQSRGKRLDHPIRAVMGSWTATTYGASRYISKEPLLRSDGGAIHEVWALEMVSPVDKAMVSL